MATTKTEVLKKFVIDVNANETYEKPLTEEELIQLNDLRADAAANRAAEEAKATARVSALAKLKELGLTEEEVSAL